MNKLSRTVFTVFILCVSFNSSVASGSTVNRMGLPDFTNIVEKNSPAVVKITTVTNPHSTGTQAIPGFDGPSLEQIPDIFRHFFERRGHPQMRKSQSLGSGFVISTDGYILTNNHVVSDADEILVRLSDQREFDAKIIGTDRRSDLALLKVDAGDLPTVNFGNSDNLKVGEWVVAIGSPFGLDYSVSAGIVSARGRSLPDGQNGNYVPFIQTDVAINPGNSGGPLFNLDGQVVGINSQIFTRSGGSIGLSFAIPTSVALNVVEQLKEKGQVARGWLGVAIQDVDRQLAESFGLDRPMGALISQLEPGGPAKEAGLKVGDVIIKFDNKPIQQSADLPHVVGQTEPGETVRIIAVRNAKSIKLKVKVGSLDSNGQSILAGNTGPDNVLGLIVEELPQKYRSNRRLSGGVIIQQVLPDSPGSQAGLQPGDVITQIGNNRVASVVEFYKLSEDLPKNTHVAMRIIRRGKPSFIAIHIED